MSVKNYSQNKTITMMRREITAVWTYFTENQVEQLLVFWENLEREFILIFVKMSFCRISSRLFYEIGQKSAKQVFLFQ